MTQQEQEAFRQRWFAQQQGMNAQAVQEALRNPRQQQAQGSPTERTIVQGLVVERRTLTPEEAAEVQKAYVWNT